MHKPIIQGSVAWQDLYDQGYVVVKKDEYMSHWPTQGWQPIETAPVDQVVIIAAQYIPLEWEIDEEKYQSPVFDIVAAYRMYDDSPYWEPVGGGCSFAHDGETGEHKVHYWMPLPEPPK